MLCQRIPVFSYPYENNGEFICFYLMNHLEMIPEAHILRPGRNPDTRGYLGRKP